MSSPIWHNTPAQGVASGGRLHSPTPPVVRVGCPSPRSAPGSGAATPLTAGAGTPRQNTGGARASSAVGALQAPNPNESPQSEEAAPATYEAFASLHYGVAVGLMKRVEDLGRAYKCLSDANALHIRVCGAPSSEALYNMSCCMLRAADAQLRGGPTNRDVSPGLPPAAPGALGLSDARLDLGLGLLEAAVDAGCTDAGKLEADPDMSVARQLRPERFSAALMWAQARALVPPPTERQ